MTVEKVNNIKLANFLSENGISYKHMFSDSIYEITDVCIEFEEDSNIDKIKELIDNFKKQSQ
ncbi:hypothetical protein [Clostridium neonatale]|uniref:hypothetical protein n=1 Tax=Clostridium neonatale TaxID=137838 RepID=UPI00291C4347|nr:hypothetical protein [Clostridium neonatale]CAI3193068.1 hypothetical protein CNEO2_130110 [Clostridium neonatale]CAI3197026.1 hypothetical protein CNEO2_160031 [Clostridium neonatale]